MQKDVDIMGVQRGEHKDGPDVCPKYVFKVPGGINPDGTKLWGWNDSGAAYCANCGFRDTDHVMLRDFTAEAIEKQKKKKEEDGMGFLQNRMVRTRVDLSLIHISEPTRPY